MLLPAAGRKANYAAICLVVHVWKKVNGVIYILKILSHWKIITSFIRTKLIRKAPFSSMLLPIYNDDLGN